MTVLPFSIVKKYYEGVYRERILELKKEVDAISAVFLNSSRSAKQYEKLICTVVPLYNSFISTTQSQLLEIKNVTNDDVLYALKCLDHDEIADAVGNPLLSVIVRNLKAQRAQELIQAQG